MKPRWTWSDGEHGIEVNCRPSKKAVALLRFFADDMEDFIEQRERAEWESRLAMPWDDLIAEAWAAASTTEHEGRRD